MSLRSCGLHLRGWRICARFKSNTRWALLASFIKETDTMALKLVIDTLEEVDAALRPHYVAQNGKHYLATQGEHPKVAEFRTKNVELLRERDELANKLHTEA